MKKKNSYCFLYILLSLIICILMTGCNNVNNVPPVVPDGDLVESMDKPEIGSPDEHTPIENLAIAGGLINEAGVYRTETIGTVSAKVAFVDYTQKVHAIKKVNKDGCFCESVSYSALKKVAEQKYFCGDRIYYRTGSDIDKDCRVNNWDDKISEFSETEYLNKYGIVPYEISKYIINAETVQSSGLLSYEDGLYYFAYCLSASAANNISYEIKTMADAKGYPTFSNLKITVVMDSNWKIQTIYSEEEYKINLNIIGEINCKTSYTENFYDIGNADLKIPERNIFIQK